MLAALASALVAAPPNPVGGAVMATRIPELALAVAVISILALAVVASASIRGSATLVKVARRRQFGGEP
jgi:hypothetical protein